MTCETEFGFYITYHIDHSYSMWVTAQTPMHFTPLAHAESWDVSDHLMFRKVASHVRVQKLLRH